jgi:hypothetical protein
VAPDGAVSVVRPPSAGSARLSLDGIAFRAGGS